MQAQWHLKIKMLSLLYITHIVCYNDGKFKERQTMTSTAHEKIRTNVYLDAEMKAKATEIFKAYGMGLSDAFNIFLSQAVMERGIPFEVKIPNKQTAEAIKDSREGKNMMRISLDELKKEIGV
jgi:DNA-damage-inducible protein J